MKKLFLSMLMVFVALMVQAKTIYVKTDGTDSGNADSWSAACKTVSYALSKASTGDKIYVAAGTYTDTWGNLKTGVSLYGGFAGTELTEERTLSKSGNPYDFEYETIITVTNGVVFNQTTSYTDDNKFSIDGFNFKGSTNNATMMIVRGGATIRNCKFIDNVANVATPAPGTNNLIIANINALTGGNTYFAMEDCLFEGNINYQNQNILGITTAAEGCYATIERVIFRKNIVNCQSPTNANMLMCASGTGFTSIRNCIFYNNTVNNAVLRSEIASEVINCLIFNNTCGTNNVLFGGKMYNSLIANNTSRFCFSNNAAQLYNTVIVGNKTTGLSLNGGISNPAAANTAVEEKVPTSGTYQDMVVLDNLVAAKFIHPTTFQGAATTEEQIKELEQYNWGIQASSPLVNAGLTSWFKASEYGKDVTNNKDFTNSHVRYYGESENVDINALEADKWKLSLEMTEQLGTFLTASTGYYMAGQVLTLQVDPQAGYRVKEWTDASGTQLGTAATLKYTMPGADTNLKVSFKESDKQFQLTVEAGEGGIVKNNPSGLYDPERVVTLIAVPNKGYKFKNWTDASGTVLSEDAQFDYTMPETASTVKANFELKVDDADDSHSFDFEGLAVNTQWKAQDGTLSISEDRSQTGTQSMCWTVPAQEKSILKLELAKSYTVGEITNTCYFNLYNKNAMRGGTLEIKFLGTDGTTITCSTILQMDFIGWREFERIYRLEFAQKPAKFKTIRSIEFILNNPKAETTEIFFDQVNLEALESLNRLPAPWNATDAALLNNGLLTNSSYLLDTTLPFTEPTADELEGLEIIKGRYSVEPKQGDIESARKFVTDLGLSRNADGTIKMPITPLRGAPIVDMQDTQKKEYDKILAICTRIQTLGAAAKKSESDKNLLNDYLDYVLDQGLMYKVTAISSSYYTLVRDLGDALYGALGACQTERQSLEWANIAHWMMSYGQIYRSDYLKNQNSDLIYNYITRFMPVSANIKDKVVAVRELKAMKRYLDRAAEITPGGYDLLKPDGTGFHHSTHYPNYMYSFQGWIDVMSGLSGTTFRISKQGYEGFKKAAIAMCMLSTRGNTNHIANSLNGRNPFAAGNKLQLNYVRMNKLSAVGGDVYGKSSDKELDGFNAYLFDVNSTATDYDGYYALNWSPTGIYRHANWVATMRAPTTKFWGSEIYDSRNRFGRYQAHGTLEVLYNNRTSPAGYPASEKLGGWDWNVVPGGTTVHYNNWNYLNPHEKPSTTSSDLSKRFDQYANTTDFCGALPLEGSGVFASDFDQVDTWGGERFLPTGLSFKKSVFAFEGMLISLGSNVTSTATPAGTSITATNLFQSYKPATGPNVNGSILTQSASAIDYEAGKWLITPEGTGYYVPKENDKISVFYGEQSGPKDDGSDMNSPAKAVATKAYINHGLIPTDKKYHFVIVPATTASDMTAIATKIGDNGGDLYAINSQDATLHSLTYKPLKTTAYAFFGAKEGLSFGNVLSAASEMLLMEKTVDEHHLSYGVCNPNLRPEGDGGDGWKATPTYTSIKVKGVWKLVSDSQEAAVVTNDGTNTTVTLTLTDGMPVYFELGDSSVGITAPSTVSSQIWAENGSLRVVADQLTEVTVYNVTGLHMVTSSKALSHTLSLPQGVYVVRLKNDKESKTSKIVIQ